MSYTHHFDTEVFKGDVTFKTGLFINGQFVDPVKPDSIDVVNPTTGKVITQVAIATAADVDRAVDAAEKAYKTSWGLKVPGQKRAQLMYKLADLLEQRLDDLAALESLNTGKPYLHARHFELVMVVNVIRFYAGYADKIEGQTTEGDESRFAFTIREPIGVCGLILPWNGPLYILGAKLAPALATGNTVVLKPSEITPLTAQLFCEVFNQAGFPPGVLNIVTGYGNIVGQAISEHQRIWKVAFTGSTLVGRKVMEAASKSNLKQVMLELGGKGPSVVFADADVEQAVKWCLRGVYGNMGQMCVAGSRVYVQEEVYDKFLAEFTEQAKAFTATSGDPFKASTQHGPQSSQAHLNRIKSYIEAGKAEGATLALGGGQIGSEGFFCQPTIFTDVKPDMKIMREEIFGPVVAITKFKDEQEVIELANDTIYGLAAAVFTENIQRGLRMSRALEAGTVWVNITLAMDNSIPFGGYKQSGIGRELGKAAIEAFTQVKSVHVNLGARI